MVTTPFDQNKKSEGRRQYTDIEVDRRGNPGPDTHARPSADADYFGNLQKFHRTSDPSAYPNRDRGNESTNKPSPKGEGPTTRNKPGHN